MDMTLTGYGYGHADGLGECLFLDRPGGTHAIPLDTMGAWGELLGIDSASEILDAILHVTERGDPEPDPVSGENAWTPAYEALLLRVSDTRRALETGQTGDWDLTHATTIAWTRDRMHAARDQTRSILGLPPATGFQPVPLARMGSQPMGPLTALDAAKQSLVGRGLDIARARQAFHDEMRD